MDLDSVEVKCPTTKDIYLRCVFIKILKVDTVNELYSGEIFLQAKWREPLLDYSVETKNIDFSHYWNPKLSISNIFTENKITISNEISIAKETGRAYIVEKKRIRATFNETLELQHFPFDCQDLSVSVISDFSANEVKLNECPHDLSKLNVVDGMDSQEWNLYKHVQVESKIISNECNIGPEKREVMIFTCRATRQFTYFIINYFMISSLLFLLTFTSFSVPSSNSYGRLALCKTVLLTSVTFKVAVSHNLPKIPYLTYLDKTIYGNILMIMSICIWHAITSLWFTDPTVNTAIGMNNLKPTEMIVALTIASFYVLSVMIFGLTIYYDVGKQRRKMKQKDKDFENKIKQILDENIFCEIC